MYEINREEVVTSFKSEYIINMFLVELVKLLTPYGMCNKAATGELAGWL